MGICQEDYLDWFDNDKVDLDTNKLMLISWKDLMQKRIKILIKQMP